MAKRSKLLDAKVLETAQKELKKLGSYGYVSKKLHAVIAANSHGIKLTAQIYDISRTTLIEWIKHIKAFELERLRAPEARRRPTKLPVAQLEEVKSWIASDPNITINALRLKIEDTYGVALSNSTVHRIIKKLKFSYITPRPTHYKQDKELGEKFKKKSSKEN